MAVSDQKRRAYNRRVRALSPPEQEALARAFYERIWPAVAPYLGASGQPSPLVSFVPDSMLASGMAAEVYADENGIRHVGVGTGLMQQMILRTKYGTGERIALTGLAHEWRHIFQNAALYYRDPNQPHDDQPIEQDAIAFGAQVVADMKSREAINRRRKKAGKPPITFPTPSVIGPENISQNIGQNPDTLGFPGSSPVGGPGTLPVDPRAAKMSTAALERVLANGNADPALRGPATEVLRRRRGKPRKGGRPYPRARGGGRPRAR